MSTAVGDSSPAGHLVWTQALCISQCPGALPGQLSHLAPPRGPWPAVGWGRHGEPELPASPDERLATCSSVPGTGHCPGLPWPPCPALTSPQQPPEAGRERAVPAGPSAGWVTLHKLTPRPKQGSWHPENRSDVLPPPPPRSAPRSSTPVPRQPCRQGPTRWPGSAGLVQAACAQGPWGQPPEDHLPPERSLLNRSQPLPTTGDQRSYASEVLAVTSVCGAPPSRPQPRAGTVP